jgi:hypothetical protein
MTREHVLAEWIGDAFAIKSPQRHWQIAEGDALRERRFEQRPFRMKTGCVCAACNHGWMSDLERAVKRVLHPMMLHDVSITLTRDDQRVLSFWAAKTLMTLQCTLPENERAIPRQHYAQLFEHQQAPARCRVAVARRPAESASWPYRVVQVGGEWRAAPPPGPRPSRADWNTYRAFMAIGHVVFHLLGFHDDAQKGNLLPGDLPLGFVEIGPAGPTLVWPSGPEVTVAGVEHLARLGEALLVSPRRRRDG